MKSSQNVQKPSFAYQNGDQILARYHEDNEVRDEIFSSIRHFLLFVSFVFDFQYYPAVIMNINQAKQQCQVMFEGYESYEIVQFADVEPFEVSFLSLSFFSSSFLHLGRILRRRLRAKTTICLSTSTTTIPKLSLLTSTSVFSLFSTGSRTSSFDK